MKTLKKIKLNEFSKDELDQRKLNALKGGCTCEQGCICDGFSCAGIIAEGSAGAQGMYEYLPQYSNAYTY